MVVVLLIPIARNKGYTLAQQQTISIPQLIYTAITTAQVRLAANVIRKKDGSPQQQQLAMEEQHIPF